MAPDTPSITEAEGFTTLELVATLTAVAVLAALLFPVFGMMRRRSEEVRCMSNLKGVGNSLFAYVADHRGKLLPRYAGDVAASEPKGWPYRLISMGYVTDPRILFCPSYFPRNVEEAHYKPTNSNASQTYGMRLWVVPGQKYVKENQEAHKPLSAIREPSDFFLVADSYWVAENWRSQGYGITPSKAKSEQAVHLRHGGKANALFADGRVEAKPGDYFRDLSRIDRQAIYAEAPDRTFTIIEGDAALPAPVP
ncbi:MAG TPA: prepilin-type N-terminal cleavage/methylation domain-containing protein [Chthoniobacteraceae bacterium]|nr:prepilin-type N-terminal cleavage/methylation domain-containing protein [Chthoniobacteraceae bacterium]